MQCNNQSAVFFCKNRLGGICSIARNCFQLKHANVGVVTPTLLRSLLVFHGVKKRGFYFNSNQWFSFVAFLLFFQQKKVMCANQNILFPDSHRILCNISASYSTNRKMDHSNFECQGLCGGGVSICM